ncbi:MAG: isocitrate lyase/PEP mutase family protein [Oscillospiraceae bacterium]|jgi:methylisocitrate lyase
MGPKTTLRALLKKGEFIWAPCIYDCLSARCAELTGYNAVLLSSSELEYGLNGTPASLANWEEVIFAVERIASSCSLPLIVDADNAGGTPMQVYRNCKRIANAGAMAITVEDSQSGGISCGYHYRVPTECMPRDLFAANIRAAVDAVKGTDCMIIARTNAKGGGAQHIGSFGTMGGLGLDEAILRAKLGYQAGAEITMIQNINHANCEDECRAIAEQVPGWRFYPDIHCTDGKSDCTFEQLQEWGFHLVSNHVAMKAAAIGMLESMARNFENKSSVYSEELEFPKNLNLPYNFTPYVFEEWIELDKKYTQYQVELRKSNNEAES